MVQIRDILKYIHNEDLTDAMRTKVAAWIEQSSANKAVFDQLSFIYAQRSYILPNLDLDVSKEWDAYFRKLKSSYPELETSPKKSPWISYLLWFLFALGVALAVYYYFKKPDFIIEENTHYAEQRYRLPDGSTALLAPNSSIRYRRTMLMDSLRTVFLNGDATFDVKSNAQQPFVVQINGAGIEVLGTVFEIVLDSLAATIENKEGLIKCFDLADLTNNLILNKGDKAVWDGSTFDYIPAIIPPPPPTPGSYKKIYQIIDYLSDRYERTLEWSPYMPHTSADEIFVNYNQNLAGILAQMDTTARITYRPLSNGRFYISRIQKK